jgi:hypothetical protein
VQYDIVRCIYIREIAAYFFANLMDQSLHGSTERKNRLAIYGGKNAKGHSPMSPIIAHCNIIQSSDVVWCDNN